jgi:hypothetical protein
MKRRLAWIGLLLCLLIAIGAVLYQRYEGKPIDVPGVTFGFAGIIAATAALFVTETTLDHLKVEIGTQTKRLSDEVTNLEDATRRNLTGFAEIFARALWLLKQAEEEVWYINFLFGFGEPHRVNNSIVVEYARIARMLDINPNFYEAIEEFYRALLDKVRKTPTFRGLILQDNSLRSLCLNKLVSMQEYGSLIPDEIIVQEKERFKSIETAKTLRRDYRVLPEDCVIQSVERLPLQLLIARKRSRQGEDRKWGCLVFLVGTENVGNRKPRGFYTELDHVVDVYRELALGFMPPTDIATVQPAPAPAAPGAPPGTPPAPAPAASTAKGSNGANDKGIKP